LIEFRIKMVCVCLVTVLVALRVSLETLVSFTVWLAGYQKLFHCSMWEFDCLL